LWRLQLHLGKHETCASAAMDSNTHTLTGSGIRELPLSGFDNKGVVCWLRGVVATAFDDVATESHSTHQPNPEHYTFKVTQYTTDLSTLQPNKTK
jgi:hypothetical protein